MGNMMNHYVVATRGVSFYMTVAKALTYFTSVAGRHIVTKGLTTATSTNSDGEWQS